MNKLYISFFFFSALPIRFSLKMTYWFSKMECYCRRFEKYGMGVLTIEPFYSDSDFKITWGDIKEMMLGLIIAIFSQEIGILE